MCSKFFFLTITSGITILFISTLARAANKNKACKLLRVLLRHLVIASRPPACSSPPLARLSHLSLIAFTALWNLAQAQWVCVHFVWCVCAHSLVARELFPSLGLQRPGNAKLTEGKSSPASRFEEDWFQWLAAVWGHRATNHQTELTAVAAALAASKSAGLSMKRKGLQIFPFNSVWGSF